MLMSKYNDFSFASSTLNTALLLSIGEVNHNILRTTFPALKPYMLTPLQIVDTMLAQHGVATGAPLEPAWPYPTYSSHGANHHPPPRLLSLCMSPKCSGYSLH